MHNCNFERLYSTINEKIAERLNHTNNLFEKENPQYSITSSSFSDGVIKLTVLHKESNTRNYFIVDTVEALQPYDMYSHHKILLKELLTFEKSFIKQLLSLEKALMTEATRIVEEEL